MQWKDMSMYRDDIEATIEPFIGRRDACNRYASFDYCNNHFHPNNQLHIADDMEKSCMSLGFYLASWGMFRGSSFLLDNSAQIFVPLVEYISQLDVSAWEIDADNLEENSEQVIAIYREIRSLLIPENKSHLTLTTKIMLGVFGSVPAYDRFFIKAFKEIYKGQCGFSVFNKKSLACINNFYIDNHQVIDKHANNMSTIGFNGSTIVQQYTRSKVIDMYGFSKGLNA